MKPSVIVWDLETVPDLGGFAAAHDLVGKSDLEIREAIGDKFPKPYLPLDRLHRSSHRAPGGWSLGGGRRRRTSRGGKGGDATAHTGPVRVVRNWPGFRNTS